MATGVYWVQYANSAYVGQNASVKQNYSFTQNSPLPTNSQWSKPVIFGKQVYGTNFSDLVIWGNETGYNRNNLKAVTLEESMYKIKALDYDDPYIFEVDYATKAIFPLDTTGNVDQYDTIDSPVVSNFVIDGVTINTTSGSGTLVVLLKNQSDPLENGIYTVTYGSGSYTLTRHSSFNGAYSHYLDIKFKVTGGNQNEDTIWVMTVCSDDSSASFDPTDANLGDNTAQIQFYQLLMSTDTYTKHPSVKLCIDQNVNINNLPLNQGSIYLNAGDLILLTNQTRSWQDGIYIVNSIDYSQQTCTLQRQYNDYIAHSAGVVSEYGSNVGMYFTLGGAITPNEAHIDEIDAVALLLSNEEDENLATGEIINFDEAKISWNSDDDRHEFDATGDGDLSGVDHFILRSGKPYAGYYAREPMTDTFYQVNPIANNKILVYFTHMETFYSRESEVGDFTSNSIEVVRYYLVQYSSEQTTYNLNDEEVVAYKASVCEIPFAVVESYTPDLSGDSDDDAFSDRNGTWYLKADSEKFDFIQYSPNADGSDFVEQAGYYYIDDGSIDSDKHGLYKAVSTYDLMQITDESYYPQYKFMYLSYSDLYYTVARRNGAIEYYAYFLNKYDYTLMQYRRFIGTDFESSGYGNNLFIQYWNDLPFDKEDGILNTCFPMNMRQRAYSGRYALSYKQNSEMNYQVVLNSALKNSL